MPYITPQNPTMQRQRSAIESFYMFKAQAENDAESVVGDWIACHKAARQNGHVTAPKRPKKGPSL